MTSLRTWLVIGLLSLPGSGGTADAPARHPPHALTVVSLNLAMREDVDRIVAELTAVGTTGVADLILLQEVVQRERSPSVGRQLGERLGLDSMYREAFLLDNRRSVGLAILSRYRWHDVRVLGLRRFDLVFRNRDRIALVRHRGGLEEIIKNIDEAKLDAGLSRLHRIALGPSAGAEG